MNERVARKSPERWTVYSVPRRYDLATMLSVSVAFAIVFAVLRAVGAPPVVFGFVISLVATVGLGQALLFRGKAPRRASVIMGIIYAAVALLVQTIFFGYRTDPADIVPMVILFWPLMGYVVGAFIGAVFLIAEYVRRFAQRIRER